MKKIRFNTASFILSLLVFYSCIVILTWQQIHSQIKEDRKQTIATAVKHHNNLVFALEQNTVRTIQEADVVLRLIKHEWERTGGVISLDQFINTGIGNLPVFEGLAILDMRGEIINAYPQSLRENNINLSKREYFQAHRYVADTLFISKPLISSSLRKPVTVISRRLNNSKGEFKGVVALQLLPSTFMRFYKDASLDRYDILSLISPDGITYSRRTGGVESSGENIIKSPLFSHLKQRTIGSYYARDAIRNIPTYFSYRKLSAYPVIATVGSSEEDLLAAFYTRQKREFAFGAILTILLFAFCAYTFFNFLQRRKAFRILVSNEKKYRSIFNGSQDAIFLLSVSGRIEAINHSAKKLFKINTASNELYFNQLYVADTSFQDFYSHIVQNKEMVFERLDGSTFIGEIAASSFVDAHQTKHLLLLIRNVSARKKMEKQLAQEKKRHQLELTKHMITAQENEREVIGRELHDNVNQVLTTVKLYLETALVSAENKDPLIRRSIGYLAQSINDIRNLSHSLSAPTLGTHSLIDSVRVLADNIKACSPIDIRIDYKEFQFPMNKDRSLALYRIVQEQLNNVLKHANATEVHISLSQGKGETCLMVRDNGIGFPVEQPAKGIGISNIESRAKAFGGRFSIDSAPGKGCTMQVFLPIERKATSQKSWS